MALDRIYSDLFKNFIFFPVAKIVGYNIRDYYLQFRKTQWLSTEELKEHQEKKINRIIKIASTNVSYYQELFKTKDKPLTLLDFPIISKAIIKKNALDNFINNNFKGKLILKSSSGSTGEPLQYYVDQDWKASKIASWIRNLEWTGYKTGDPYVNVTGFPHGFFKKYPVIFTLEQKFFRLNNISPFELNDQSIIDIVEKIKKARVNLIRGYASSLYEIAKFIKKNNIKLTIKSIVTTGETLFNEQRETIKNSFNGKVYDEYGADAGLIAFQCEFGSYHINCENIYIEIVDNDLKPCILGQEGQIVVTALSLFGFPIIRYNTEDIGSLSDINCPCGRGLPILKKIQGRISDRIITGNGKVITIHMFTGLFMPINEIDQFRIRQKNPNRFIFDLKVKKTFNNELLTFLREKISILLGNNVEFDINFVENVELHETNAKRKFFIRDF